MRRILRSAAIVVAAALLAGCSQPLPEPQPDALPAATPPALSVQQAEGILDDVHASLAAADAQLSAEALAPRVAGPAASFRTAEYKLAAAAGNTEALTTVPPGAQTLILPTSQTWPRTMMVVTEPPADLTAPLLLTLVQDGPRDPYYLWSWVRLFPGVETPALAQPEVGSAPVEANAADLAVAPADVMAQYVDVVTNREQSQYAGVFTDDPLRSGIWQTRDAFIGVVGANGTLAETYTPHPAGVRALATADGGALVVGTMVSTTSITLVDSTLKIGDQTAVLLGSDTIKASMSITWLSVVAFVVPPAGSDAQIQVLGGEHARTQVSGQ